MKSSNFRVSKPHAGRPPCLVLGISPFFQLPSPRCRAGGQGRPFPGQQDPLEFQDSPTPVAHLGLFKAGLSPVFRRLCYRRGVYVAANLQFLLIMLGLEERKPHF